MAYTSGGLVEVLVKANADLNALADVGSWAPGYHPYYVRAVMAIIDNDIAATGVIKFNKRPTFGSDTGIGDGDVAVLNLTTAHLGGRVVYKDGLNALVKPGEQVMVKVTDVTGANDKADIVLLVEPAPEVPVNNTRMMKSA